MNSSLRHQKFDVKVMLAFMTCPAQISPGTPDILSAEFCNFRKFLKKNPAMVGISNEPRPFPSYDLIFRFRGQLCYSKIYGLKY